MLNDKEAKDTILHLRANGHTIGSIHSLTGIQITKICEVIYEQNQNDIHRDGHPNLYLGVF